MSSFKGLCCVAGSFALAFSIGCNNTAVESGSASGTAPSTTLLEGTDQSNEATMTNISYHPGDTITIKVPEMHCPFYCYPKVEETLTELGGIEGIELVPQKAKDKIDDPRIIVKLNKEFSWDKAVQSLDEVGFSGATASLNK